MANKRITDLTLLSSPAPTDLLEIAHDPTGTPTSYKATVLSTASYGTIVPHAETLSGDKTLTDSDISYQILNSGGSNRKVTLPAEGATNHLFVIVNSGTLGNLNVWDDGNNTILVIKPYNVGYLVPDATSWWGYSTTVTKSGSSCYGFFGGGTTGAVSNVIDYIILATTTQNATDTGDLTVARSGEAGVGGSTYGFFGGGDTCTVSNVIDYITKAIAFVM